MPTKMTSRSVSEPAWKEIMNKFLRGGLDRELCEKATSRDEDLERMMALASKKETYEKHNAEIKAKRG